MIYIQKSLYEIKDALKEKGFKIEVLNLKNPQKILEDDLVIKEFKKDDYPELTENIKSIMPEMFPVEDWVEIISTYLTTKEKYNQMKSGFEKKLAKKGYSFQAELEPNFNDVYWKGGYVASIETNEDITITLHACGDVYVNLYINDDDDPIVSTRDKNNAGCFREDMENFIPFGDIQLAKMAAVDSNKNVDFDIQNNNWYEISLEVKEDAQLEEKELDILLEKIAKVNSELDLNSVCDSSDLFETIEEAISYYEEDLIKWMEE